MESTEYRCGLSARLRLAVILLCLAGTLGAQTGAAPLATEIQTIERNLARSGISAAERRDSLVRLARLRQLSGDMENAARNWLAAAAADSGQSSDSALVAGAACLAAIGEWEQAAAAVQLLIRSGRPGPAALQARYLDACAQAWNGGDIAPLTEIANNPGYTEMRPAMYYTLWRVSANSGSGGEAAAWKARLLAEFPQSPEGRIAAAEGGSVPIISTAPSPIWLLSPGGIDFDSAVPPVTLPSPPPPSPATAANKTAVLQTGLFNKEANARAQAGQLQKAGFSSAISRRQVKGAEYWAVTVSPGADINRSIAELKKAGFESFPVKP